MAVTSIRRHLNKTLCLAAALLLPLGGLSVYWTAKNLLIAQFDATLAAKAQALITAAEIDDEEFEIDFDVQAFAGFGKQSNEDYYQIWMADGSSLQRSPSLGLSDLSHPSPGDHAVRHMTFAETLLPDGRSGRILWKSFVPADDDHYAYGRVLLAVASESVSLNHTLNILAIVLLGTGAVGLGCTLLLLQIALSRGLRPLHDLGASVQKLQVDQPEQRLITERFPVELQGVGEKINNLLARVQASISRERRFSSHAAHEMRTPLAELKTMMELIIRWPEEATAERLADMQVVLEEMENLIGKLSLLSRADSGGQTVSHEPVDVNATIQACLERFQPLASERGVSLRTQLVPTDIPFQTDPVLWQTILNNLIGNAVHHAPTGSHIQIEAGPGFFAVSNPAPELTAQDVDFLFDRFWRKRTGRESGEHSGLGLSIVASCTTLLGGHCRATLSPAKGLRLEVRFDPAG